MAPKCRFRSPPADAEREPLVVVVSDGFWRRRLGGEPSIVGSTILLNGELYTVLGITPPGLRSLPGYGFAPDVYLPVARSLYPDLDAARASHFQLIGRLHDNQDIASATARLAAVSTHVQQELGERDAGMVRWVGGVGGVGQLREFKEIALFLGALLVVTVLVLGIACANVAGLLLARGTVRRREIAMRLALGASRALIVQQLLTEGAVLSLAGTICGVIVVGAAARLLPLVSLPLPIPIELHVAFDARLMWLSAALAIASTLLCAVAPAIEATRPAVMGTIKQEPAAYVHRRFSLRNTLVIGQVAVSAVLLVTTALFLRNLALAHTLSPEFDAQHALVAQLTFVAGHEGSPSSPAVEAIVDRIGALPGVEAAAFAAGVPLSLYTSRTGTSLQIEWREGLVRVDYESNAVSPRYFVALGLDLLSGRDFSPADRRGAPHVVIVNSEFVRRYFLEQSPLGRHIFLPTEPEPTPAVVVGVVANSKYRTIGEDRAAALYRPYLQRDASDRMVHVLVRTLGDHELAADLVPRTVLESDPAAAVTIQTMTDSLAFAFLPSQIGALLVGALGLLGASLATIGL